MQELKEVKVIDEGKRLVEKKRGITLRMLLAHTGRVLSLSTELLFLANTFLGSWLWIQLLQ